MTLEQANQWFRRAGAPLVLSTRARAQDTLTRALPFLLWTTLTFLLYSLAWQLFFEYTGFNLISETLEGNQELPEDTFYLLFLLVLATPILVTTPITYILWRGIKRLPRWGTNLIALLFIPFSAFASSPAGLRWLAGADIVAEGTSYLESLVYTLIPLLIFFFGLDTFIWWLLNQTWYELTKLVSMVTKVLPTLMLLVLFTFVNGDLWRVADSWSWLTSWRVVSILGVLSTLVIFATVLGETKKLLGARKGDRLEAYSLVDYQQAARNSSPAWEEALKHVDPQRLEKPAPLKTGEWYNLYSLPFFAQLIQAAIFGFLVCAFFIWFGNIAIPGTTIASWLGHPVDAARIGNLTLPFSQVLVKVSMLLGGFAALNFVAQTSSDRSYAQEFLIPIIEEVRETVMMRNIYHARLEALEAEQEGLLEEILPKLRLGQLGPEKKLVAKDDLIGQEKHEQGDSPVQDSPGLGVSKDRS